MSQIQANSHLKLLHGMLTWLVGYLGTRSLKALSVVPRKTAQGWLRANRTSETQRWCSTHQHVWNNITRREVGGSQSTAESRKLWTCPQSVSRASAEHGWGAWPSSYGIPQTLVDYRLSTEPKGVLAQRCSLNMTACIITVTGQSS